VGIGCCCCYALASGKQKGEFERARAVQRAKLRCCMVCFSKRREKRTTPPLGSFGRAAAVQGYARQAERLVGGK